MTNPSVFGPELPGARGDSDRLDFQVDRSDRLVEWLLLGVVITLGYWAVPGWAGSLIWRALPERMLTRNTSAWLFDLLSLGYALLLVAGAPKRSGVRLGAIRRHWRGVLLVCGLPIALTACVYPFLPERPFAGSTFHMWLTNTWHQDLVFPGYLYGRFVQLAPSYVHPRVRIRWALILAAVFFSGMHLPWFQSASVGYVVFMLAYTFFGMILIGLARQWTGSILYGGLAHMGVNFVAWVAN